jgi:hypothetical protein
MPSSGFGPLVPHAKIHRATGSPPLHSRDDNLPVGSVEQWPTAKDGHQKTAIVETADQIPDADIVINIETYISRLIWAGMEQNIEYSGYVFILHIQDRQCGNCVPSGLSPPILKPSEDNQTAFTLPS